MNYDEVEEKVGQRPIPSLFIKSFAPEIESDCLQEKKATMEKALSTQRSQDTGVRIPTHSEGNDS